MRSPSGSAPCSTRGVGAGGDEHDVGVEHLGAAVGRADLDRGAAPRARGSSANAAVPADDPHAFALDAGADVGGLGHGEALDPVR